MTAVNLRGWPGASDVAPPSGRKPKRFAWRLGQRVSLVIHAAADLGSERFGLGAYLVVMGATVLDAGLIVADDLAGLALEEARAWASARAVGTPGGPLPWAVVARSEFTAPGVGIESRPARGCGTFTQRAYVGAGFVVGADLGRTLGLLAEASVPRREPNAAEWSLWLPGWGERCSNGWRQVSPHRPPLRLKARRAGWQAEFAPCHRGSGKWVDGRSWRGAFVDVLSLAYALDADRSAGFSDHRRHLGLPPLDLPLHVAPGASGAEAMARAVEAVHRTALALDDLAAQWFTTPADRAVGRGRVNIARLSSPGALATEMGRRAGLAPPLRTFDLGDAEHGAWCESFHGGWCDADQRVLGLPVPVVAADLSSAFPLAAHHLGWWQLLCAERLDREDVTGELRAACERAAADPTSCLDPALWRRLGFTLAEVVPNGEPWPVEVDDRRRPDGRLEVCPVRSPERPMHFTWPDVVAAAARSGRVPEIRSAVRLVPVGRQEGLQHRLAVLPGLTFDLVAGDPAVALVRHRRNLNVTGRPADKVLAAELRVIVNALVFGNAARFDSIRRRTAPKRWVEAERPGPYNFVPVAASVTAGARLLLGVLDCLVSDRGGSVVYRDTDSSFIAASPAGGEVSAPDGAPLRVLCWAEVDEMLGGFASLAPARWWPTWKVERGSEAAPLHTVVLGPKRHVEFVPAAAGPVIVDRTEANLGGVYVDPPTLAGPDPSGGRRWCAAGAEAEVAYRFAVRDDPSRAVRRLGTWAAFPALKRRAVTSPAIAASLPACLAARPGTPFLEVERPLLRASDAVPVALDPGGDLAGWAALGWVDRLNGRPVRLSTSAMDINAVTADTLGGRLGAWGRSQRSEPIGEVVVDPLLVQHRGRVSGVIDAAMSGQPGDLVARRPVYDDEELWERRRAAVAAWAGTLGSRSFARRTGLPARTAARAAAGNHLSRRNVLRACEGLRIIDDGVGRCALDECSEPVWRPNARYCCAQHAERAHKRRQRSRDVPPQAVPNGPSPGQERERKQDP